MAMAGHLQPPSLVPRCTLIPRGVQATERQRPVSSIVGMFHGNANRLAYCVKLVFRPAGLCASGSPSSRSSVHPFPALRDAAQFAVEL